MSCQIDLVIGFRLIFFFHERSSNSMSEEGKESIIPDKKADSSSSKTLIKTDGGMEFLVDSRYSLIKCIGTDKEHLPHN